MITFNFSLKRITIQSKYFFNDCDLKILRTIEKVGKRETI